MIDTAGMTPDEAAQVQTFEFMMAQMPDEALELLHRLLGEKVKERKKAASRGR